MYELESEIESSYRDLCDTFEEICKPGATWHIQSEKTTSGLKQDSGATSSLDRRRISPSIGGGPDHFKTNISVPKLPVGIQTLFLLPDRILVEAPEGYGAVKYSELVVTVDEERFIESGEPPSGARVVGTTWRYVNKSGEPDRRKTSRIDMESCIVTFSSDS